MASTHAHQNLRPIAASGLTSHQLSTTRPVRLYFPPRSFKSRSIAVKTNQNLNWAVRLSLVDQSSPPQSTVDVERLVGFLYDDLPHLFDDQGIDRTAYDEQVKFRDPITKHDTISGYLFNISMLKMVFRPDFQLHWVKQVWFYYQFVLLIEQNSLCIDRIYTFQFDLVIFFFLFFNTRYVKMSYVMMMM